MTADRYKYVGDDVGTDLSKGTEYEVITRGIDNVVLQVERTTERIEIPKSEFDNHLDTGMLREVQ